MTELFTIPEQKSPRLLWIEKNDIIVRERGDVFYAWDAATESRVYEDCDYDNPQGFDMISDCPTRWLGIGATEEDAITDWAKKNKVRLWNEETI